MNRGQKTNRHENGRLALLIAMVAMVGAKLKKKLQGLVVDETEVKSVNEAAVRATKEIHGFCDRHNTDPPAPPEETFTQQQLLILNRQEEFRVPIVDGKNRIRDELKLEFDYRDGKGRGRRYD